jgi:hypothetical protein
MSPTVATRPSVAVAGNGKAKPDPKEYFFLESYPSAIDSLHGSAIAPLLEAGFRVAFLFLNPGISLLQRMGSHLDRRDAEAKAGSHGNPKSQGTSLPKPRKASVKPLSWRPVVRALPYVLRTSTNLPATEKMLFLLDPQAHGLLPFARTCRVLGLRQKLAQQIVKAVWPGLPSAGEVCFSTLPTAAGSPSGPGLRETRQKPSSQAPFPVS